MRTQYLNLMKKMPEMKEVQASLSLRPFVAFLERKAKETNSVRAPFFGLMLSRIKEFEGWDAQITRGNIEKFRDLFELVYFTLSAPVTEEDEYLWALGEPLTPHIFFGTEAFYHLLTQKNGHIKNSLLTHNLLPNKAPQRMKIIYALVLEKYYGYNFSTDNEIKITVPDEETGLNRHYSIGFDTRFIETSFEGPLPEIDFENFQLTQRSETESIHYLQEVLPFEKIRFEGFSVVHITDVTVEFAIEKIKDIIVNLQNGQKIFCEVVNSLRTLLNTSQANVTLLPLLKVNGKLVLDSLDEVDMEFQKVCSLNHLSKEKYLQIIEAFIRNPRLVIVNDVAGSTEIDKDLRPVLTSLGVREALIIPIFFQKEMVGILELFAHKKDAIPADALARLKPVIPLLEQLLQASIHLFNNRIDNVIKDQFTTLHPSVHWKFNEAAWTFIQKRQTDSNTVIEKVRFPEVYPLYGAVDIRNSTIERNKALKNDMFFQLDMLDALLQELKAYQDLTLIDELLYKARNWRRQLGDHIIAEDEFRLFLFLENEVAPLLELLGKKNHLNREPIEQYLKSTESDGSVHTHRNQLEKSLQKINRTVGKELDKMNQDIQKIYPCYFEKFRSDGVEYDIYIGQAITPQEEFFPFYLKNLRLVQLSTMAAIARQTRALMPQLPTPLETTQLIFINTHTIDISFRSDERRFDVEGGYNVRYEMMKKRIDKVHLLNSSERLTQPGKIALVYSQQKDIEEYLHHIFYLQERKILLDDLEYLDLERLQALDGLKALRIGVSLEEVREEELVLHQASPILSPKVKSPKDINI